MKVGKYINGAECHDSCEEIFCARCNDYYEGYNGYPDYVNHTCNVKVLRKTPIHPAGFMAFDFETTSCTGEVNCVVAVYTKVPYFPDSGKKQCRNKA